MTLRNALRFNYLEEWNALLDDKYEFFYKVEGEEGRSVWNSRQMKGHDMIFTVGMLFRQNSNQIWSSLL